MSVLSDVNEFSSSSSKLTSDGMIVSIENSQNPCKAQGWTFVLRSSEVQADGEGNFNIQGEKIKGRISGTSHSLPDGTTYVCAGE